MHNLFVYGTLKRGYGNNRLLKRAEILGTATSIGKYHLLAGGFPFMIDSLDQDEGARVRGEIYRVNEEELARCDRLEGHPRFYMRELRAFKLSDGTLLEAWVYLWQSHRGEHFYEVLQPDDNGIVEWRR